MTSTLARPVIDLRRKPLAWTLFATLLGCTACSDDSSPSRDVIEIDAGIPPAEVPVALGDGSDGGSGGEVADDGNSVAGATTGLRIDGSQLCATVGEPINIPVSAVAPEDLRTPNPATVDVSARVELGSLFGDSIELIAQGDETLSLRMTQQDINGLVIDLDDEASVTVYVAGFPAEASGDTLIRKPVTPGCLYALRLDNVGFCGTSLSRGAAGVRLGSAGRFVERDGCDFTPLDGLTVIDLPEG